MRVLVTGNLGYIGSVLVPKLVNQGHEVWGFDTGYYKDCILGNSQTNQVSKQIKKDIRDIGYEDLEGVDIVVHLAALSNDPMGELNPELTHEINTNGSIKLAEISKTSGVKRFIFSSSCSIYGQNNQTFLTEEAEFNPQTAYAQSKVDTERELSLMASDHFSPTFLRNATAYGLSLRPRLDVVVNNLTAWAFTTGKVNLLSDGKSWRPLVHVKDICKAICMVTSARVDDIHNQPFNIGDEQENYQIISIANIVESIVPNCNVQYQKNAESDTRSYNVSFQKIKSIFPDFRCEWNVVKGVEELYSAFQANQLTFDSFNGRLYTRLKQLQHLSSNSIIDNDLRWTLEEDTEKGSLK